MSSPPFSLRIFVADGDPDGLRLVERSNWIGKALMFPRALYTKVRSREEFKQTGVYLLLGPRTDGEGEMLYIGEGDPVGPRLESHYAKKDFWTQAVFFVAGSGQPDLIHLRAGRAQVRRHRRRWYGQPLRGDRGVRSVSRWWQSAAATAAAAGERQSQPGVRTP